MITASEYTAEYYQQLLHEAQAGQSSLVRIWIRRKYRPRADFILPDKCSKLQGLVVDYLKRNGHVEILCLFPRWQLCVMCKDKLSQVFS